MWYAVFVSACVALFIVPLTLVFNEDYQDRVLGRAALLGIAFFAALFLFEIIFGGGYHVEREEVGLLSSVAVFLVWHVRAFCARIKRQRERQERLA